MSSYILTNTRQESQPNEPCLNVCDPILNPENDKTSDNENDNEYDSNDEYSDDVSDDGFDTYIASKIDGRMRLLCISSEPFKCAHVAINMYGEGCKEILLFKGCFQDQATTILYDENVEMITITTPDCCRVYDFIHFNEFCDIYKDFKTDNEKWSSFFDDFSNKHDPIIPK
jgi:hypothetical protein